MAGLLQSSVGSLKILGPTKNWPYTWAGCTVFAKHSTKSHRVDPDPDLARPERLSAPEVDPLLVPVAGDGEPDVAVLIVCMLHQVLERRLDLEEVKESGDNKLLSLGKTKIYL